MNNMNINNDIAAMFSEGWQLLNVVGFFFYIFLNIKTPEELINVYVWVHVTWTTGLEQLLSIW